MSFSHSTGSRCFERFHLGVLPSLGGFISGLKTTEGWEDSEVEDVSEAVLQSLALHGESSNCIPGGVLPD